MGGEIFYSEVMVPRVDVFITGLYSAVVRYDWDEDKNQINIHKHGFDFVYAEELFAGPMLVNLDTREDYGEDRWIGIGDFRDGTCPGSHSHHFSQKGFETRTELL